MKILIICLFLGLSYSVNAQEYVSAGVKRSVKKIDNTSGGLRKVVHKMKNLEPEKSSIKKVVSKTSNTPSKKSSSLKRVSSLPNESSSRSNYKTSSASLKK